MVAKYYVAVRPRTNDSHPVHKEGCPFLKDSGEEIYLGLFDSGREAVRKSRLSFARSENCLFCCKETNIGENNSGIKYSEHVKVPAKINIPLMYQQEMFCCVN